MPRFIKQTHNNTCGAVAVINSFKNIKHKDYTAKDVKSISRKLKTEEEGTWDTHLIRFLRDEKFKVGYQKCLAYSSVRAALRENYNFIFVIETEYFAHYVSVIKTTDKGVWLTNSPKFSDYQCNSLQKFPKNIKTKVFFTFEQLKYFCVNWKHNYISIIYFKK